MEEISPYAESLEDDVERLTKQRDALAEALRGLDEAYCRAGGDLTREERIEDRDRLVKARAALAAMEGE